MKNILDKIKTESIIGNPQKIIDNLINSSWCNEEFLELGYKTLQEYEESHVIVFFQLPFVTKLPSKWIKLDTNYGVNYFNFRNIGSKYNDLNKTEPFEIKQREDFDAYESTTNAILYNDIFGLYTKTQVMVSMQVLEPRYKYFKTFLNNTRNEKAFKSLLVPSGRSWKNPIAFTTATYENDLIRKLHKELVNTLTKFLQIYAVEYLDPIAFEWSKLVTGMNLNEVKLNNFFAMFKTGRVSFVNIGNSMLYPYFKIYNADIRNSNSSLKKLNQSANISIYEEYLLEAVKQVELGNPNLAIVQAFMILEWFANEMIGSRLIEKLKTVVKNNDVYRLIVNKLSHTDKINEDWTNKIPFKDKYELYLKTIGIDLTSVFRNKLEKLRILRNHIVHKSPTQLISANIALESINDAMKIIQFCMQELKFVKKIL